MGKDWSLWRSMPKLEFHRHVEGSVRAASYVQILKERSIKLPIPLCLEDEDEVERLLTIGPWDKKDFHQGLSHFAWLRYAFADKESIAQLLCEAFEDAVEEGIVYQELRLSPGPLLKKGISGRDILEAVEQGVSLGTDRGRIRGGVILGINREMPHEYAESILSLAEKGMGRGVCGIDLLSDEAYPPELYSDIFQQAKEIGLHRTVHAGEFGSSKNIVTAIEDLKAQRIGHGLHLYDGVCPHAAALARDENVHIECCPTSNEIFGVLPKMSQHPIRSMLKDGICISINTDDPGVIHRRLPEEYCDVSETFALGEREMMGILLDSVDAMFCDGDKPYVKNRLENWMKERKILL